MAGHRAPRGRRAERISRPTTAHRAAPEPGHVGPTLRTTVLATAAAVGAVATGTFTAILPTPGDGTTTTAAADEGGPLHGELAAGTAMLAVTAPLTTNPLVPVHFTTEEPSEFAAAAAGQHLALLDKATALAAELAELHAKQEREQAERARLDAIIADGGVDGWIAEALRVLDLPQSYAPGIKKIIMAESGGNPRAINRWDSNARRGTPSQGLMQTIPSTFKAYVHPDLAGHSITHPVANITAGVRYMIANYGTDTLTAGGRSDGDGDYIGY